MRRAILAVLLVAFAALFVLELTMEERFTSQRLIQERLYPAEVTQSPYPSLPAD